LLELVGYPLSAQLVGLAVHDAGTKVTLGSTEYISRVGIELDADSSLLASLLLRRATGTKTNGDDNIE
jgi:hypothetical protein